MRAAYLTKFHRLEVREKDPPRPGPGDLLVQVRSAAICGTDLALWQGKQPDLKLPVLAGHEATGVVAEVGEAGRNFQPGDRVVLNPLIYCGECYYCRRGLQNLCEAGGLMGREADGAYAEYVVVEEGRAYRFPEGIDFAAATCLIALYTCLYGQRKLPYLPGASVAILGQGVTGLLHTQLARYGGARPVIAVARSAWKLELSRRLGADVTIQSGVEDPIGKVKDLTGGRGADIVIESAGAPETIRQAIEIVRPGGTILQFGTGPRAVDGLNLQALYLKDLTLLGSRAGLAEDFERAIKLVGEGHIDLGPIVTHHFPLSDIQKGFEFVEGGKGRSLRAVIDIAG